MASITANGFCAVAALSRYTSGMPWMVCFRTGKSSRTFCTSKQAGLSLLTVLMEFLEKDPLQRVFQRRDLNAIHDILREGVGQQGARLLLADAARLQVEQRLRVQLPNGGAVGAAHVVGPDLQLRLGVDHRIVRQHQVLRSEEHTSELQSLRH